MCSKYCCSHPPALRHEVCSTPAPATAATVFITGEDLIEAVEREVFEETGLRVRFHSLIAVRQAHGFLFGKSDMFFCCGLVPVSESGASNHELKPCVSAEGGYWHEFGMQWCDTVPLHAVQRLQGQGQTINQQMILQLGFGWVTMYMHM